MPRDRAILRISLRTLLVVTFICGATGGMFGPSVVKMVREWRAPPAPPVPSVQVPAWLEYRWDDKSDGYFESAETPLR